MTGDDKKFPQNSKRNEIDAFLGKVAGLPQVRTDDGRGRLIFAMDATASREPAWDQASHIQAQMFSATADLGGLDVQLCYYRGYQEFEVSPWCASTDALLARMTAVTCRAGQTQIRRVLEHARGEARRRRVNALVFIGDCLEEDIDRLDALAGELGVLGVPLFLFHEGRDPVAARGFAHLARLSGGAVCPFDAGSARQLRELLGAVAVYAAGGRAALEALDRQEGGAARLLLTQLKGS